MNSRLALSRRIALEAGICPDSNLIQIPGASSPKATPHTLPIWTDGEVGHVPGVDVLVEQGKVKPSSYRGRLSGLMNGVIAVGEDEYPQRLSHLAYLSERGLAATPSRLVIPVDTHAERELTIEEAILRNIQDFQNKLRQSLTKKEWEEAHFLWTPYCGSQTSDDIAKQMAERVPGRWINPVDGPMAKTMNAKVWAEFLRMKGFRFPKTTLINDDFSHLDQVYLSTASSGGAILKPDLGASGMNQFRARSVDHLRQVLDKNDIGPGEYVSQAIVPGLIICPSTSVKIDSITRGISIEDETNQIFNPDAPEEHVGNESINFLLKYFPDLKSDLYRLGDVISEEGYTGNFGVDIYLYSEDDRVQKEWEELQNQGKEKEELEQFVIKHLDKIEWCFGEVNMRYLGASRGPFRANDIRKYRLENGQAPEAAWQIKKIKKTYGFEALLRKLQSAGLDWDQKTRTGVIITNYDDLGSATLFHYDIHHTSQRRVWEIEKILESL